MEGPLQLDAYSVTWYGLAPLATAAAMLLLGVFVVARERGSRESVLFGVLAVTVIVWLGCFGAMYLANAERVARFWARTAYLGITFIAPAVLSFAVAVTRDWQRRRRLVAASWLLSALLCAASVGTDALFRGLERYPWGYYPRFRWLGVPFIGVFFAQLGLALRQYWIDRRAATSAIHRQRARWLLVAFSIAYLGCIDYVPAYGVALYPFGYLPVFLFIVLSAWTIRRFRLVDFTPELAAREILATVADPLIVCDVEGRVRLLNPAAAGVLGCRPEEVVGRPLAELVPPPERERLAAYLLGGEIRDQGIDLRARDGGAVPVELAVSPLRDRGGAIVGSVLVARDARPHLRAIREVRASEERFRVTAEALRQSEETFRTFTESAPAAIFICEGEHFRYMNQAAELMTGKSAAALLAMPSWEIAAPGSRDVLRAMLVPERGEPVAARREVRLLTNPGGERWVDLTVAPLASHGQAAAMITAYDVTESKLAHDMVRASERRLRDMLENVKLAALTLDTAGVVTYCNDYLLELLGVDMEELVGSAWFERWVPPEQSERLLGTFTGNLAAGTAAPHDEYEIVTRDGDRRLVSWSHTVLRGLHGEVVGTASIGADITERKRVEERLAHEALHDSLTGLPNRALFMDRLRSALARAQRHDDYRLAVMFLDLDRFKVVNDSLGHLQGDQLLIQVSRRLEGCVRPADTIARLGGDEFTVLFEELEQPAEAARAGARIRAELAAPFDLAGHEIFVTASVGIALGAARYVHPEDLLRDADTALHSAKAQGKTGQQVFDTPMHERAVAALQLENDLRRALERNEYVLHYQPIVELADGRLIGFEALVRWQHPERGLLPPDSFINVAEETGLILPLGDWVLAEALRQLKEWERRMPSSRRLALTVNISSRQFAQPDLVARIGDALAASGVAAGRLKVEITESLIVQNQDTAADMLRGIKDLGCSVCLDDFGTGYSSLNYLLRFPIDTLKVDRSFLADLGRGSRNSEIVTAVIGLAHRLGLDVIAEGVENELQRRHLMGLGCVFGQGFLFSKPLPADRAAAVVAAGESPPREGES
ncbi:MAG: EAL domain-containing protein [Acidobacteria bacterium]|nr:EAL domain-containing protein [Acidobacteriota bacterium]